MRMCLLVNNTLKLSCMKYYTGDGCCIIQFLLLYTYHNQVRIMDSFFCVFQVQVIFDIPRGQFVKQPAEINIIINHTCLICVEVKSQRGFSPSVWAECLCSFCFCLFMTSACFPLSPLLSVSGMQAACPDLLLATRAQDNITNADTSCAAATNTNTTNTNTKVTAPLAEEEIVEPLQ